MMLGFKLITLDGLNLTAFRHLMQRIPKNIDNSMFTLLQCYMHKYLISRKHTTKYHLMICHLQQLTNSKMKDLNK